MDVPQLFGKYEGGIMSYNFRNMVVEGGGVKAIAYIGALEVLNKLEITTGIQRIGGTSAGAINAILLGL